MTEQQQADPLVYQRDASVYVTPNVSPALVKVLHWPGERQWRGWQVSACGRSVLDSDSPWRASEVPDGLRCRGSGCRQRWQVPVRSS